MGRRQVRDLEETLAAAAGALPQPGQGDTFHFHDEMYPYLKTKFAAAARDVAKLGLT